MSLLDIDWEKKVFTGSWTAAEGPFSEVVEPATGSTLGHVGTADCRRRDRGLHQSRRGAAPLGENAFRGSGRDPAPRRSAVRGARLRDRDVDRSGGRIDSRESEPRDACRSAGMLRGVGVAFASQR